MYRSFKAIKDAYITDRIIKNVRQTNANVGVAGTLDLFKIYGLNKSGSTNLNELSRILVKFDLSRLQQDVANGKLDPSQSSFFATIKLFDIYGGQPTPEDFTLKVYPISRSWSEGNGSDIVYYQDKDNCNFLTATFIGGTASAWFMSGANASGLLGSSDIDIISSGNIGNGIENLWSSQFFDDGSENLSIDVTKIVSATLAGLLPDEGFRISFQETEESDPQTRFVKRFGSRHITDTDLQPRLIVGYDDSRISHEGGFYFDSNGTLFLENYIRGQRHNLVSGSSLTPLQGEDCLLLKLVLQGVSGSGGYQDYTKYITASQHKLGNTYIPGIYSASFALLSNDPIYNQHLKLSGSVEFIQVWGSFDETVSFNSGTLLVRPQNATTGPVQPNRYSINVVNPSTEYDSDDIARIKVFVFDHSRPYHRISRVPIATPTVVSDNAFYSVRDAHNGTVIIPFERTKGSTRLSADAEYMYFDLDMNNFAIGHSYVIDLCIVQGGETEIFQEISPSFTVVNRNNRGAA